MKLVIFAGGIGTRMWPLSRKNAPKQFDKIFSGMSTLQLAIDRLAPTFGVENIFIQTIDPFVPSIKEQVPDIPDSNIIIEPERRNLAPAVCLAVTELEKRGLKGPMALLWADHLMDYPEKFVAALKAGENIINDDPDRFVFLGEEPRFANNNLGWIKVGDKAGTENNVDYYSFEGWKYKPDMAVCEDLFSSGKAYWNPGYFITSVEFLLDQYKTLASSIYQAVSNNKYDEAEETHFDRAIIEKVDLSKAVVIKTNMGWSDPGTLYALKEALAQTIEENVTLGNVTEIGTSDSLIYNLEENKLVTAVGLKGMVVVNTKDALVVVPKEEVINITNLVKKLKEEGKDQYL
jgi:mannose-1-phosphate guanylyltransferase